MKPLADDFRRHRRVAWTLFGITSAALAVGVAAPLVLASLSRLRPELGRALALFAIDIAPSAFLLPLGMAGVTFACLAVEAACLDDSTLHRMLENRTPSIRTDLFYFVLRVSGAAAALAWLLSLGSLYRLEAGIKAACGLGLLRSVDGFLPQFAAVVIANSLSFYLFHRLMHTRLLWEIHKVHHSAEDYNVLLPYRNHPIDQVGAVLFGAFFAAVLGARHDVTLAWVAVNGVYQSMVHSRLDWTWSWVGHVLITPQAHRVHHSRAPEHFNRNFGILTFWDRLFGTYYPPPAAPVAIGLADRERFNTDRPLKEASLVVARWLGFRTAP